MGALHAAQHARMKVGPVLAQPGKRIINSPPGRNGSNIFCVTTIFGPALCQVQVWRLCIAVLHCLGAAGQFTLRGKLIDGRLHLPLPRVFGARWAGHRIVCKT
jgi:hypothetical protein